MATGNFSMQGNPYYASQMYEQMAMNNYGFGYPDQYGNGYYYYQGYDQYGYPYGY